MELQNTYPKTATDRAPKTTVATLNRLCPSVNRFQTTDSQIYQMKTDCIIVHSHYIRNTPGILSRAAKIASNQACLLTITLESWNYWHHWNRIDDTSNNENILEKAILHTPKKTYFNWTDSLGTPTYQKQLLSPSVLEATEQNNQKIHTSPKPRVSRHLPIKRISCKGNHLTIGRQKQTVTPSRHIGCKNWTCPTTNRDIRILIPSSIRLP